MTKRLKIHAFSAQAREENEPEPKGSALKAKNKVGTLGAAASRSLCFPLTKRVSAAVLFATFTTDSVFQPAVRPRCRSRTSSASEALQSRLSA